MKNIYCLQNKLSGTFMIPFFDANDWESVKRYHHDFIIVSPDEAKQKSLQISLLWHLGKYDDLIGKFEIFDVPEYYDLAEAFNQLDALKRSLGNE